MRIIKKFRCSFSTNNNDDKVKSYVSIEEERFQPQLQSENALDSPAKHKIEMEEVASSVLLRKLV